MYMSVTFHNCVKRQHVLSQFDIFARATMIFNDKVDKGDIWLSENEVESFIPDRVET